MRALPWTALAVALATPVSAQPISGPADPVAALHALLEEAWEEELRDDPLLASSTGDHRYGDRLPSVTREDLERQAGRARERQDRLRAIDRAALPAAERVNYDM
jgi:uncharacterized protein (DUF885 family)